MRATPIGLLLLASACGYDVSHTVNIAPSAESHTEDILRAVKDLNLVLGEEAFTARAVDSGERRDDEIVIRGVSELGDDHGHWFANRKGIVLILGPTADTRTVAHELGHAAGLGHHDEPWNLMFPEHKGGDVMWYLTDDQVEALR